MAKSKSADSFNRPKAKKEPAKRYLIVCEGSKTEPNYFKEMRHALRLRTTNIEICGEECGSDPVSVYNYAAKVYDDEVAVRYDAVYCVIDRDSHKNLNRALKLIEARGDKFNAVLSDPCFEVWLLLHHVPYNKSFIATPRKSAGDLVLSLLKKHDRIYAKGSSGTWNRYSGMLSTAIENSKALYKSAERSGNFNPSTRVHELVEQMLASK